MKDWKEVLYGQVVNVITDSTLLKASLSFNGDDV